MAKLFPLSDKHTNYLIYGIAALVVVYLLWKFVISPRMVEIPSEITEPSTSTGSGSSAPAGYSNTTVFEWKSPIMTGKQVEWIQYEYNRYAKERKKFGKTPDWPTISQDQKFGKGTHEAMYRLMGKHKVTYSEVKTRVDYLVGVLNGGSPASASVPAGVCTRCLGKGFVDIGDIIRLGKQGVWSPGICTACKGTGKIK